MSPRNWSNGPRDWITRGMATTVPSLVHSTSSQRVAALDWKRSEPIRRTASPPP